MKRTGLKYKKQRFAETSIEKHAEKCSEKYD